MDFEEIVIPTERLSFPALAAGDGPIVVCWHGFPDHPASFGPLAERLVAAGCSPTLPAVMVSNVSRGDERWAGSIAELGSASERRDQTKPVIIGIGRVFGRIAKAHDPGLGHPLMLAATA